MTDSSSSSPSAEQAGKAPFPEARAEARLQVLLTWGVKRISGDDAEVERAIDLAIDGLLAYVDRVSRERERAALERAAKVADDEERAFMESSERMDSAGRSEMATSEINAALACKAVAADIRALIDGTPGGDK